MNSKWCCCQIVAAAPGPRMWLLVRSTLILKCIFFNPHSRFIFFTTMPRSAKSLSWRPMSLYRDASCRLNAAHSGHTNFLFTVELCDVLQVMGPQAVVEWVPRGAQVVGPHDWLAGRGVGQAQGVAKLMDQHGKQVGPLGRCRWVRPLGGLQCMRRCKEGVKKLDKGGRWGRKGQTIRTGLYYYYHQ